MKTKTHRQREEFLNRKKIKSDYLIRIKELENDSSNRINLLKQKLIESGDISSDFKMTEKNFTEKFKYRPDIVKKYNNCNLVSFYNMNYIRFLERKISNIDKI